MSNAMKQLELPNDSKNATVRALSTPLLWPLKFLLSL